VADFSLNNLTLFGLVLAIGIVVDDAIVVVEAVEHHIEKGLRPRDAAIAAMKEVSSPVIAVGLVLSAVFVPCAFVPGIVGQFFRQFALTIAVSTIISTLNSLTLSPALAAILLKPLGAKRDPLTWLLDTFLGWFFNLFDWLFRWSGRGYVFLVGRLLRVPALVLTVYGGLLVLTYWGFFQLPAGFIPTQDKGYFIASVQLPDSASAQRTRETMARIEQMLLKVDGVKHINAIAGNSFVLGAYGSNFGSYFLNLEEFKDRRSPELQADKILAKIRKLLASEVPEAVVNVFPPPAVSGLGRAGGWRLMVQDRNEVGLKLLQTVTDNIVDASAEQREISGPSTVFNINAPKLYVDIDRDACQTQGVALGDVFQTMQGFLGSRYVNDFNRFGRTWQVVVQADAPYRNSDDDLKRLKVRSASGQMVPLGSIATVSRIGGPLVLTRYTMYPAAAINGNLQQGVSTGQGIALMEQVAERELPKAMGYEWTELAYLERQSSNTGMAVFGWSVVFVFLVLAALYESWSLPLAVILVVPMCVLSAIAGVWQQSGDINIFTQIGFVVLIGLACKNAILIVEFARAKREAGADVKTATLEACELRLRPILMTSFAFILGVVPLVFARGAGAEMRQALGIAVFAGMLGVTAFGVFLTPVFFYVIDWVHELPVFNNPLLLRIVQGSHQAMRLGFVRRPLAAWLRGKPQATASATPMPARAPANKELVRTNGKHHGKPGPAHTPAKTAPAKTAPVEDSPETPLAP
jgi:multidrug efflux pump